MKEPPAAPCNTSPPARLPKGEHRLRRPDAALDPKDAFLAKRQVIAADSRVAGVADVGVGHHQGDVAASALGQGNEICVEADRPLGPVTPHPPSDIGPDFGRLAGRDALGGLAHASENVPLRKADHRGLRDLVDFERLTAAEEHGGEAKRCRFPQTAPS